MGKIYTKQNWSETVTAMRSGQEIEVDAEVFEYFLEVLPPSCTTQMNPYV